MQFSVPRKNSGNIKNIRFLNFFEVLKIAQFHIQNVPKTYTSTQNGSGSLHRNSFCRQSFHRQIFYRQGHFVDKRFTDDYFADMVISPTGCFTDKYIRKKNFICKFYLFIVNIHLLYLLSDNKYKNSIRTNLRVKFIN